MVLKTTMEAEDEDKIMNWDDERKLNLIKYFDGLNNDLDNNYIIGLDIAGEGSVDKSVMIYFRKDKDEYILDGWEEI
jgi:hypothetical protein